MEFSEFQRKASGTDQRPGEDLGDMVVHLLGLAGEAGSVAAEYKKMLRDGQAHAWWKPRMREELGDVLWYVAAIASHLRLDLDEIAHANLEKTRDRWQTSASAPLDAAFPAGERLPREGVYEFVSTSSESGKAAVDIYLDGATVGAQLTDASYVDDGYRFHDIFHLSYAVLLGWSPVTRLLLARKRKSDPDTDENEDGGRAIVIEEGIAALVFGYASQHNMLENITRVDQKLLDTIQMVTGQLEVGARSQANWEAAILQGFEVFRQLVAHQGGRVHFDSDAGQLRFEAR
ncbi:MAG: nucleoside triphosphate pyrophosphohydrolase family protein [Nocardioides sp.]